VHGFKRRRRKPRDIVLVVGGEGCAEELADMLRASGYHVVRIRTLAAVPPAVLATLAYGIRAIFVEDRLMTSESDAIPQAVSLDGSVGCICRPQAHGGPNSRGRRRRHPRTGHPHLAGARRGGSRGAGALSEALGNRSGGSARLKSTTGLVCGLSEPPKLARWSAQQALIP
jgi:hypothetical protein